MAKGSREQSTLRYFKEADIELAEVLLEAATRIVERRSKETVSPTTTSAPTRGRKAGARAQQQTPAQPKPDPRQPNLPGTDQPRPAQPTQPEPQTPPKAEDDGLSEERVEEHVAYAGHN
jgi:hypothetical protein